MNRLAHLPFDHILFEQSPVAIAVAGLDTSIQYANQAFGDLLGYSVDEALGLSPTQFIHADHLAVAGENIRNILAGGAFDHAIHVFLRKDGSEFWCRVRATSWNDDEGNPLGIVGYFEDYSTQVREHEELDQIQRVFDAMSDPVIWNIQSGEILYANRAAQEFLPAPGGLVGKFTYDLDRTVTRENQEETWQKIKAAGKLIMETDLQVPDGPLLRLEHSLTFSDIQGTEMIITVIRNVTERRMQELELRRVKFALDQSQEAVCVIGETGHFLYVNQSYCELFGYSESQLTRGMSVPDVDPDVRDGDLPWEDWWNRFLLAGNDRVERLIETRDGTPRWVEIHVNVFRENDEPRLMTTLRDITERIEIDRIRAEQERQFKTLFHSSPLGKIQTDGQGVIQRVNHRFTEMTAWSTEDLQGTSILELTHPDDKERFLEVIAETASGRQVRSNKRCKRKNGQFFWVELFSSAVHDEAGNLTQLIGAMRDITDEREAQRELELQKFGQDAAVEGLTRTREDGTVEYANAAFARMLELPLSDIIGKRVPDFDPRMSESGWKAHWEELRERGSFTVQSELRRSDGSTVPTEVSVNYVEIDGRGFNFAFIQDISERVEAARLVLEQTQRFRSMFEESPLAIFIMGADGSLLDVNERTLELMGVSREQFARAITHSTEANPFGSPFGGPDQQQSIDEALQRAREGEVVVFDKLYHRLDESTFWGRVTVCQMTSTEHDHPNLLFMMEDITETKQNQTLLERQAELERSNQELSQFAYVASHDLREPLRTVTSFTQMIEAKHASTLPGDVQQMLGFIKDASSRMDALVTDLLTFSRIGGERMLELVALDELLAEVLEGLNATIEQSGARIAVDPLPTLQVYRTELSLVFQNLIANALKFQSRDEQPCIAITARQIQGGQFWEFSIQDNGIGIDPAHHEQIFFIFKRLHIREDYEGTGIGLAHCKRAIDLHGGTIRVESSLGEGSTFVFTVPSFLG